MQEEVRRTEGVKSFLRAKIIFNNSMSSIDCVVKSFSPDGAKVALGEAISVPNEFELHIPQKGKTFHARMAWRDATAIGVEFLQPAEPPNHTPAADMSPETLGLRVRALEMQNAELKILIRELSKRLEDLGQDPDLSAAQIF